MERLLDLAIGSARLLLSKSNQFIVYTHNIDLSLIVHVLAHATSCYMWKLNTYGRSHFFVTRRHFYDPGGNVSKWD